MNNKEWLLGMLLGVLVQVLVVTLLAVADLTTPPIPNKDIPIIMVLSGVLVMLFVTLLRAMSWWYCRNSCSPNG